MKSKNSLLISTIVGLFFLSASLNAQKSIELGYNVSKGDTYIFVTNLDQDISFDAGGATMTLEQEMTFDMTSVVTGAESSKIEKEVTFDAIKMTQSIFGMTLTYDSGDPETWTGMGEKIAAEMNKLIGKTASLVMDEKGNIIEMDMGEITDNDDLSNNLTSGNTYAVYPEGKVKVGDSWEKDIDPLEDSDMNVKMKYTLLKFNKKEAIIKLEGVLSGKEIQGENINLEGTTMGEMTVNAKTGMLITSTMDIELALDLEQQGMKVPANIMSTTVTTATKVN